MKLQQHTEEPTETSDELKAFAATRGISPEVLQAAGVALVEEGEHEGWWGIPYPHRTGTWKTRYRNPGVQGRPKYLDDTGAKFHLYNPLRLGPGEELVLFAEGEFDTLALIDQGYAAIGVHGVANVAEDDEQHTSRGFRKEWALLFEDTLCITIFDNDDAGRKAGRALARGLNGEAFDGWDDRYGDVNDWHRDDPSGLADALARYVYRVSRERGLA